MLKEMITSKAGFPFYTDYWKSYFCKMTGEQVKECLRIIFHFNETFEILESGDLAIEMVTTTIIGNIKRDAEKRTKQITANKNNGSKGGRPPKNSKLKITKSAFPTLQEVSDYCQERKNSVNPEKWISHYQSNGWKVGKNQMKDWKAAVRTWEGNSFGSTAKPEATKDSFCQSLNQSLGQDLIKSLIEGEIITIKLTGGSANDKWDALSQDLKESVLAKVKAKFGKQTKISF